MITVAAAIIHSNEKILIAKRGEKKSLANLWEFPGGKVEENESPEECVVREIQEELGITIKVDRYFAKNQHTYDFGTIKLLAYLADFQGGIIEPTEHADVKWVNVNELRNYEFAPADIPFIEKLEVEGI